MGTHFYICIGMIGMMLLIVLIMVDEMLLVHLRRLIKFILFYENVGVVAVELHLVRCVQIILTVACQ